MVLLMASCLSNIKPGLRWAVVAVIVASAVTASACLAAEPLEVGFAETDITPDVAGKQPVWIAGYGQNRRATGVHDPLHARAVVLRDVHAGRKIALVSVDLVGLQYPEVRKIREKLTGFHYVMVSSTHDHEGPDVVGIWGPSPVQSGVDPSYLNLVIQQAVKAVEAADKAAEPATAAYGTADDEGLLKDARLPKVFDSVLRALRFTRVSDGQPLGILVQWNCHPEAMGSKNSLITADFPYYTVAALTKHYKCPVAYFTGTVGGLMTTPSRPYKDSQGKPIEEETFPFIEAYGEEVAHLARKAIDAAEPIRLTPSAAFAKPITFPMTNKLYQTARLAGVLNREGRVWTGDFEQLGEPLTPNTAGQPQATETEVAYLRLGELHVACIPGEIYPELVYGHFQDPVDPGADFPDAPLEPPVMKTLGKPKTMLFGLANDEIGYIIPKRQWDQTAPFCYGRKTSQYGEINSCGFDVAPILMQALARRVKDASSE